MYDTVALHLSGIYSAYMKKKKLFSFDTMVDVNVYKLYSTCINTCLHGRCGVGSSVNRFIIFLREVGGSYIKMSEINLVMEICSCTDK